MAEARARARIAGSIAAPLAGLAIVLALGLGAALAAPSAELWERWLADDPDSTVTVDHGAWDRLIGRYLRPGPDGVDRFDYAAVDAADKAALAGYVDSLAAMRPSALSRAEQLPYWINLYNALTVQVVLDHFPVETIRDIDISPGLFSNGPWGAKLVTIEGEEVSLDDIEHRILRPIWRDARLHYALNCASIGCPALYPHAFTAEATQAYLDAGARAYVNHPRGVSVRPRGVRLSKIYDWYRDDFGDGDAALFAHLARYAEPPLAAILKGAPRILGYDYDWRLNDVE
jgi:hypothetical protein